MKHLFILFIAILLTNCSQQEIKNYKKHLSINLKSESKSVKRPSISIFTDSISYVVLDQTNQNLIGEISDIEYFENCYYIYDRITSAILIFDKQGTFVLKISNLGKGPEEYVNIAAFDVNPKTGSINILDTGQKKMMLYSKQGQFLDSFYVKDYVRDFAILPSGDYLFYTPDYNGENYRRGLWKVNSKGEFKEQLVNIDDKYRYGGIYPRYFCRISKNKIGLMGGEDKNEIYHISDESFEIAYKLEVDIKIPDYIKEKRSSEFNILEYPESVYTKNSYMETDNLLIVNVTNLKRGKVLLYDKKNDKIIPNASNMVNNIDSINGILTGISFNNSLIFKIPEVKLLKNELLSKKIKLRKKEYSNPILQIYHLK